MAQTVRGWLFFMGGFYLTGILTIIPIPEAYLWYRPQWVLMFALYCQMSLPHLFNPCLAWAMGLLLDSLLGSPLGEHALVFAAICYIASLFQSKVQQRPLWQQVEKIFLLVCLAQILILWFHVLSGQNPHTLLYWLGTITSCATWPIFAILVRGLSHRVFNIAPLRPRSL